mmetsp:Transcript_75344/g.140503  ORF Transcript_75344/g.140503 Transcript_75344/m.140503 type:complete len:361 (-) Transcript_75344:45-1127(-)
MRPRSWQHKHVPFVVVAAMSLMCMGHAAQLRSRAAVEPLQPGLDPYVDMQPFDTALGALVIGGFLREPQGGPQGPIQDNTAGVSDDCPVLLSTPEEMVVEAPDACAGSDGLGTGLWTGGGSDVMRWKQYCSLISPGVSRAPMVEYYLPEGDYFGYSQMQLRLTGSTMQLYDCTGELIFTINEFVFLQRNWVRWFHVDTKVWMQYVINRGSKAIAKTKYLPVDEGTIAMYDESNNEIATFIRSEGWDPKSNECSEDGARRKWTITYTAEAANVFPDNTQRWPMAELVTMIALRDPNRVSMGFIMPTLCEVIKTLFFFALVGVLMACLISCCIGCKMHCQPACRVGLFALELAICPHRRLRK